MNCLDKFMHVWVIEKVCHWASNIILATTALAKLPIEMNNFIPYFLVRSPKG